MPRPSLMVPINTDELRKAFLMRNRSIASMEESLGVTRQAINGWLSSSRIPPRKLSIIAEELELPDEDYALILEHREPENVVLFRTNRNKEHDKEVKFQVEAVANDFFQLHREVAFQPSSPIIRLSDESPSGMAEKILKALNLNREQLTLESVIRALESLDIHVLFYDFGKDFVEAKAQAVCVVREDEANRKAVIFVNSYEAEEDVLWRIFHEACHIFSGHKTHKKSLEKFCNEVATQAVTPDAFFENNRKGLREAFGENYKKSHLIVRQIADYCGASFMGVVLSLWKHKILSRPLFGILMKVHYATKDSRVRIKDIISPGEDDDATNFYYESLNDLDLRKFFKLQHLVRNALVLENISIGRAAELLDIDPMTAEELATKWKIQMKIPE